MIGRSLCLLACLFASVFTAAAQPADLPGDEIKPVQLEYKEKNGAPGRWAQAEFAAGEAPLRYYVRGTDISAPLSIQVIAANTAHPLQVTLHRQSWGRAEETGSTGSKGAFIFEGRAFGDVGVQLVSSSGGEARGTVIFWQGTPAPPSMARIYTPPQGEAANPAAGGGVDGGGVKAASGGTSPVMYVIAGLLAAIVLLLGLVVLRRGSGKTAAALILAGGMAVWTLHSGPASAQIVPNPFDPPPPPEQPVDKDKDASAEKLKPETPPDEVPDPFDVDKPPPEVPRDKDKDATAGKPDDKPADPPDGWEPSGEPKPDEDSGYEDRLEQAQQRIDELNRQASANRAEIERLRMLIESDKDNEPDPSNMPPLPLSCRPPAVSEDSEEANAKDAWQYYDDCRACYDQPLKDLDETLLLYEKLRIIYNSTRNYVNTAIAMGDAIEKPHYLVEAAWAQQKADILKTFKGTKDAYDAKFAEFNDRLNRNLDAVGQCETKYNNNPMWRETDAKMFYQTVKASYQRAD